MNNAKYIELTGVTDHTDEQAAVMAERCKQHARLIHYAFGLGTEVGELQDAVKKVLAYGKPLDVVNIKEELGDIKWYFARLCKLFNLTIEEIDETNINKLQKRYGDKFTEHAALNRDLEAERKILEE